MKTAPAKKPRPKKETPADRLASQHVQINFPNGAGMLVTPAAAARIEESLQGTVAPGPFDPPMTADELLKTFDELSKPRQHVEVKDAPSSIERLEKCPASGSLAAVTPRTEQSPEAAKGDLVHAAIQAALCKAWPRTDKTFEGELAFRCGRAAGAQGLTDSYDIRTVEVAVKLIEDRVEKMLDDEGLTSATLRVEVPANLLGAGYKGAKARLDVLVDFGGDLALVVELKTGAVQVTGPSGNRQLHDYLVGALVAVPNCIRIYGAIVQPAMEAEFWWREASWSTSEIFEISKQLRAIREAAWDPNAPLVVGSHCSFCPAAQMCPARRGMVDKAIETYTKHGKTVAGYMDQLAPIDRALVYNEVRRATSYLKKFDELVKAWALNTPGAEIPGYELGPGKSTRRFIGKKEKVDQMATAARVFALVGDKLKEAKVADRAEDLLEMVTPTTVEKVAGKLGATLIADLVVKEPGATTLKESNAVDHQPRPRPAD